MSDATVNIHVQRFVWTCVVFSPGWIPMSRTVGSYSGHMSDFLSNWQTMCQSSYTAALATSRAGTDLPSHHQRSHHRPPLPPAGWACSVPSPPSALASSAVPEPPPCVSFLTGGFEATLLKVQFSFPLL